MATLQSDALLAVLVVGGETSRVGRASRSLALVAALLHGVALAIITVHQIHLECGKKCELKKKTTQNQSLKKNTQKRKKTNETTMIDCLSFVPPHSLFQKHTHIHMR